MQVSVLSRVGHNKYSLLYLWSAMAAFLIVLCWSYAGFSLKQQMSQLLQQQLPAKLQNALYYSDINGPVVQLIKHNIDTDLHNINHTSVLPLFSQCSANVVNLISDNRQSGFSLINIKWLLGNKLIYTQVTFDCHTQWTVAIFYPCVFATLLLLLWCLLPQPLDNKDQKVRQLLQKHMSIYRAHQLARQLSHYNAIQHKLFNHLLNSEPASRDIAALVNWLNQPQVAELSESQFAWFMLANNKFQLDKEHALEIAFTPATLRFSAEPGQIVIHGLHLTLVKTPYFYYLWYAYLRCQSDGWQLNPAVNRSDKVGANVLIELMQHGGGHSKAINDLLENGLRAKTLDQNRNKLKAELISLLGESLAQDYLFDTERDFKSGRYRYRLSLPANLISLPPEIINTP